MPTKFREHREAARQVTEMLATIQPAQPTIADMAEGRNSGIVLGVCCDQLMLQQCAPPPAWSAAMPAPVVANEKYLADQRRFWPPPCFILLISLMEIGVFVYVNAGDEGSIAIEELTNGDSWLIYRPDRRWQLWRFVSYALLHASWLHLSFNVAIQLLYGVPLELLHGSLRVAVIYVAGVLAGALGTSVVDSTVYLVGASGGVYALLTAQLSNVLLNFGHMRHGLAQLVSVGIFVCFDLGYALYSRQLAARSTMPTVSYIAHMTGALAGLTVGLLLLRNFDGGLRTRLLRWLALGIWAAFTVFTVAFNLINTVTAQMLAEHEGEVIKQHLLHDLGIS